MPASQLVVDYLTALTAHDTERVGSLISDDFSFHGPMQFETTGRDAFLAEATGAYMFTRGLRILRQWEDANEVCSIYELDVETPTAADSILMTEWDKVKDGRLTSSVLVYDTSVHDALMPSGHIH